MQAAADAHEEGEEIPPFGAAPVSVPGTIDGWFALHERFGTLSMRDNLEPTINYARNGAPIPEVIAYYWGRNESRLAEAQIELGEREISTRDVHKVWAQALGKSVAKEQKLLGAYPVMYGVDDQDDIRDPVGMIGQTVRVLLNVVTAPRSLVDNLTECLHRAHLQVEQIVPSALASGSGSLIDDEIDIALTVALSHVGQSVELIRQRQ